MKRIEAIIRPAQLAQVCDSLDKVGYPGVMISDVEGHGTQKGTELKFRGVMYKVPLVAKKRLVLIVKDMEVDKIMKAIRDAVCTGKIGDGKIFVSPMDDAMRIRTGETGEIAV
jgi:nitrogen regulatory protein P-II 1